MGLRCHSLMRAAMTKEMRPTSDGVQRPAENSRYPGVCRGRGVKGRFSRRLLRSLRRWCSVAVQRYQRVQQHWCGMSPLIRDEGRTR